MQRIYTVLCHPEGRARRISRFILGTLIYLKQVQRFLAALGMTVGGLILAQPTFAACGPNETPTDLGCIKNDPLGFASSLYSWGLGIIGGVAVLSIIYGAYLVLSSQGDPDKLTKGKSYIVYSIIGLILAVSGYAFYRIIGVDVIKIPGFQ